MRSEVVLVAATLALVGPLIAAPSRAGEASNAVVAARQASMKEMAASARTIAEMFDGKRTYERSAFQAAADTLSARAGAVLIGEFPPGTLGAPSGARPEIDEARPEFEALARHIGRLADALGAKAKAAPAEITADMRMVGPPMDGGSLLGKRLGAVEADPAAMPAEHLLHLILQDCANCHSKFRRRVE